MYRLLIIFLFLGSAQSQICLGTDPQQKQLLFDFYTATGGPQWVYSGGSIPGTPWDFNSTFGYCWWYGIMCESTVQEPGCDQIVEFGFGSTNLQGTIPNSMASFTSLGSFTINDNPGLKGTLPSNLFLNMNQLVVVYLNNNSLTGPVPNFGNPGLLAYLSLVHSRFTSVNLSQSVNLTQIAIDYSSVSKIITDEPLPLLTSLTARSAPSLNLPLGWLCLQKSLEWVDLSYNSYKGTVPVCLSLLPNLNWLFLSHNFLTRLESSEYSQLITLDVSYNLLQDSIDSYSFPRLVTGIFSHNNLTGLITYFDSGYLVNLYLDNNPIANTNLDGWPICALNPNWSFNLLDIRNTSITDAWECGSSPYGSLFNLNPNNYIRDGNIFCPTLIGSSTYPLPWNILVSANYFTLTHPCF